PRRLTTSPRPAMSRRARASRRPPGNTDHRSRSMSKTEIRDEQTRTRPADPAGTDPTGSDPTDADLPDADPAVAELPAVDLAACVEAAIAAPSLHNSHP